MAVVFGEPNTHSTWLGSRGMWVTYAVFVTLLHLFLLSIPFLSIPMAWTLTNVIHNICNYLFLHVHNQSNFFHALKGTPWEISNQGGGRNLTHWEQIDYGIQFTTTRKLLTVVPIILFILASWYTNYEYRHFIVNFIGMCCVVIPKLPFSIPFFSNNPKSEVS